MDEKLKSLHNDLKKAEKALEDYIKNTEFKTCSYEDFKKIVSVFPIASSVDSEFLDLLEIMIGKDIWEMGYYKYETVYFTDICSRIMDCDYEEDLESICRWFKTKDEEEALNKAVETIIQWSLKHKLFGFKLDW